MFFREKKFLFFRVSRLEVVRNCLYLVYIFLFNFTKKNYDSLAKGIGSSAQRASDYTSALSDKLSI